MILIMQGEASSVLQTVGNFHTVWVKYREWVGGIWLDSLKQKHACFMSRFA